VKLWLEGLETAATAAEGLSLTTTLIPRMARLEDRVEPDEVEIMPRNNPSSKPN
jgi:hypothetical protein